MPDVDRTALRGRLIQSFASLPGMNEPGQRTFLLEHAGYGQLTQRIAPQLSTVAFFTEAVGAVARGGPRALSDFVAALASVAVVGVDRQEAMARLAAEVARLDPADLDALTATGTPYAGLRERARTATLREISEIGSKYLRELYFRHRELEERVEEFLADDSTCFLVVSKPGRGKTSLLCSLAERRLGDSLVLLMSARVPVFDPRGLLDLIAARLGYGADWPGCFADLARTGGPGRPPLLLLDAINESPAKPDAMKSALHELLRQAESAGVKVVVTCRTDFWQFYRAPFWSSYVRRRELPQSAPRSGATIRVEDVPLFPADSFPAIAAAYFAAFGIQGDLRGEAAERCRHALVLRILCEAYRDREIGVVEDFRLFRLFKLFWERKVEQVADATSLRGSGAVAELVLEVARLMRQSRCTSVPRSVVAATLRYAPAELDSSDSLYSRVIDEEIILEESVDDEIGVRNVVFIYDRFAEYVLALSLYVDCGWAGKCPAAIAEDALDLMAQEPGFGTLRGALEFLVLRLEDRRADDRAHLAVIRAMLGRDWKWRGIAAQLVFQLDPHRGRVFWDFVDELASQEYDFVRRIVAEQLHRLALTSGSQVLRPLNRLAWDANSTVRASARRTLLRLPPAVAAEEVTLLLARPYGDALELAARLLVGAPGGDAPVQAELAARLVGEHYLGERLRELVVAALESTRGVAYTELPWLAECEDAFAAAPVPSAPHLRARVRAIRQLRARDLEQDRLFVRTMYERVSDLLGAEGRRVAAALPRRRRYGFVLRASVDYGTGAFGDLMALVERVCQEMRPRFGLRLLRLRGGIEVTDAPRLVAELWLTCQWVQRNRPGPEQGPDEWVAFCVRTAAHAGHRLPQSEARALAHPEQLALWLWESGRRAGERRSGIDALEERLLRLPEELLADEFTPYEYREPMTRHPLADLLEALCRVLRDRPAMPARVLAPLVVWHETRDSPLVDEALAELHWMDPDAFWLVLQSFLNHPDQRLIDVAARAGERAERADESGSDRRREVLEGLAEIINEVTGVPVEEVRMGADFLTDLDIDSLSMVEVAVAAEEQFGLSIPDESLMGLRTVRDAVDFIVKRRSQSVS